MLTPERFAQSVDDNMKTLESNNGISYHLVTVISMFNALRNNPYHVFGNVLIEKGIHNYVLFTMNQFRSNVKYQGKAIRLLLKMVEVLKIQLPVDATITAQAAMESVEEDARREAIVMMGRAVSVEKISKLKAMKKMELQREIEYKYHLAAIATSIEKAARISMMDFPMDEEVQQSGSMLMSLLKTGQDLVQISQYNFPNNEEIRKSSRVFESGRKRFFNE